MLQNDADNTKDNMVPNYGKINLSGIKFLNIVKFKMFKKCNIFINGKYVSVLQVFNVGTCWVNFFPFQINYVYKKTRKPGFLGGFLRGGYFKDILFYKWYSKMIRMNHNKTAYVFHFLSPYKLI